MPYALVQPSLDQHIDPDTLMEASVAAPSVARADCHRLARSPYGIVVQNIPENEAKAFRNELARRGFTTEAVPQSQLPSLAHPARKRGIRFDETSVTALDGIGREATIPAAEIRFAAGGFLSVEKYRETRNLEWDYQTPVPGAGIGRSMHRRVVNRKSEELAKQREFRLDLFHAREPYRWAFLLDSDSFFRVNDEVKRLRQEPDLIAFLARLGGLVPHRAFNLGIASAMRGEAKVYPSLEAFEEEIVWRFFQTIRQGNSA